MTMPLKQSNPQAKPVAFNLWVGLLMLAGVSACGATQTEKLIPPNKPVPLSYFGIHNHRFHDPTMRPTLDFGTWRLWDAGVAWSQLQPKKNEWRFARLDFALNVASTSGLEVLMTFGRTPAWASARPVDRSFYGLGEAAPPRNMADFANFVRQVATRYAGRIKLYEVWNEPASGGMFSGTVEQMVEMTKIVDEEVARVDPQARVVCPSPAKHESLAWFRRFVAAGGANHCDIIGYHFYTDSGQPEDKLKLVREVSAILEENGLSSKPLWDTESGHAIGVPQYADSPAASAPGHVARWLILEWASGVERFYWYSWDHDRLGFKHPNGVMRDKALAAYKRVQTWMLGSIFQSCEKSGVVWLCDLRLQDGRVARVFWTSDNSESLVDIERGTWVEDISGYQGRPDTNRLKIKGDPVLIIGVAQQEASALDANAVNGMQIRIHR